MKRILTVTLLSAGLMLGASVKAQGDKPSRPSPAAVVSQKINTGATITINYSQPSVKGRTIGTDLEPMDGKVWRMGANEATTFETDKNVTINGKALPAGKYSLFGLKQGNEFTLIFNSEWKVWGTQHEKVKERDALRVPATTGTAGSASEKLTYTIDPDGKVTLLWGTMAVNFVVQ